MYEKEYLIGLRLEVKQLYLARKFLKYLVLAEFILIIILTVMLNMI